MGQHQSGPGEKDQKLLFSPESQDKLKAVFLDASVGDDKICLVKGLQERLSQVLHRSIALRLCQEMRPDRSARIDYQSFVFLANTLLKATLDERAALVQTLAAGETGHVELLDLRHYVEKMVLSYLSVIKIQTKPNMESQDRLTASLLGELREKHASNALTQDDLEKWLLQCPLFAAIQTNVFRAAFGLDIPHDYKDILPAVSGAPAGLQSAMGVLEQIFVNHALPQELRSQWRLLFSNRVHGESFSKMVGTIVDKGPTLVVVKDTDGHLFGGFAPENWHCNGTFYGTAQTFLFQLSPKMEIFHASGFNENYMYFNVNQQTLPNGLGFGGKFEYFGLFLSGDFGRGFTAPSCTTFNSRLMSGKKRFQVDTLEVWAVGPVPRKPEDDEEGRPSILDADPEGAAMLEMIRGGQGMHSDGLRETPTADTPGEKHMPAGME